MTQAEAAVRETAARLRWQCDQGPGEAGPLARDYLLALVRRGLDVDGDLPLDPDAPIDTLGVDSLLTFDLIDQVEQEFGINLLVQDFTGTPSITQLSERLVELLDARAVDA